VPAQNARPQATVLFSHPLQHLLAKLRVVSMMRGLSRAAMLQTCPALFPISRPQPLRLPIANPHQSARLDDPQLFAPNPRQHFHPSQLPLAHLRPPQSDLLSEA
jgi:hypothetical protein